MTDHDPALRFEGRDISLYFGLSYSTHLVLEPARLRAMRPADAVRLTEMLYALPTVFPDVRLPHHYLALAALGASPDCLSDTEMERFGVTFDDSEETGSPDQPYHYRGESYGGPEWMYFATEDEASAEKAGRIVVNRTLLQSMPHDWQLELVRLLDKHDEIGVTTPEYHQVRAYNAAGLEIDDPVPHYKRGRTHIAPSLAALT